MRKLGGLQRGEPLRVVVACRPTQFTASMTAITCITLQASSTTGDTSTSTQHRLAWHLAGDDTSLAVKTGTLSRGPS